jgi:phospholipid/cholesterol/gamma-HCH transport system permease protein
MLALGEDLAVDISRDWLRREALVVATGTLAKPVRGVGGFFAMSLDTLVQFGHPPFAWREFLHQSWFVARVSVAPAIGLAIPFNVIIVYFLGILLSEIGANDISGTAAALALISQSGPGTTVLVIGGAGATAMCADLGARTIREEIDAMRVMGINPLQRLAVPRVAALAVNAVLLNGVVILVGLGGCYFFAVYVSHSAPGAFVGSLTLLTGIRDVIISFTKAALFGITAGLIACYKGFTAAGGPQGVGNAVNETVVYSFAALFVINTLVSAVGAKMVG